MCHEHNFYTHFKMVNRNRPFFHYFFVDDLALGSLDNVCKHLGWNIPSSLEHPSTIVVFMLRGKNYRKQVPNHIIQGLWMMIS